MVMLPLEMGSGGGWTEKQCECSVHTYPCVRTPIRHRHGNIKEADEEMSQELSRG